MFAAAVMWYSISWMVVTELKTGNEALEEPFPAWFGLAPVVVDIAAYWMIATAFGGI